MDANIEEPEHKPGESEDAVGHHPARTPPRSGASHALGPDVDVTVVNGTRRGSWELVNDPKVGVYFYCYTTDETTWEVPEVFSDLVRGNSGLDAPPPPYTPAVCCLYFACVDIRVPVVDTT